MTTSISPGKLLIAVTFACAAFAGLGSLPVAAERPVCPRSGTPLSSIPPHPDASIRTTPMLIRLCCDDVFYDGRRTGPIGLLLAFRETYGTLLDWDRRLPLKFLSTPDLFAKLQVSLWRWRPIPEWCQQHPGILLMPDGSFCPDATEIVRDLVPDLHGAYFVPMDVPDGDYLIACFGTFTTVDGEATNEFLFGVHFLTTEQSNE